jgi:hypothetical protein
MKGVGRLLQAERNKSNATPDTVKFKVESVVMWIIENWMELW